MRKKNINFNQKILMGPGPTNIDDKIKKALSREPISHLDPDFFGILDNISSSLRKVFKTTNKYGFEVTILAEDKKYYKFQWIVEKYYEDGPLKDCWLTTSVSNPISLGSSI